LSQFSLHQNRGRFTFNPRDHAKSHYRASRVVILTTDDERDAWMSAPWTRPRLCSSHCWIMRWSSSCWDLTKEDRTAA